MSIKNKFKKVKEKINKMIDIVSLNLEIDYLTKELEESKKRERPYIDKINQLKSEVRVLRILKTKLEKKVGTLNETIREYERTTIKKEELFKD